MINIKIGIIYYIDDLILHNKVDYIEYIKVKSSNEIKLTNKPTLIIGWDLVKDKFKNINILNKKINKLYTWTFSFNEKKQDYIKELNKFITVDVLNIFNKYKYVVISPIFNTELHTINDYIKYFEDCKLNNIYVSKLLQLSILCDDTIYRINLRELKYFNIEYKLLLFYLKEKYENIIYDKDSTIENTYVNYFAGIDENIIKKYITLFNKVTIYN
jgi:hypothetical protein